MNNIRVFFRTCQQELDLTKPQLRSCQEDLKDKNEVDKKVVTLESDLGKVKRGKKFELNNLFIQDGVWFKLIFDKICS
jgi:hypothetical protein